MIMTTVTVYAFKKESEIDREAAQRFEENHNMNDYVKEESDLAIRFIHTTVIPDDEPLGTIWFNRD